MIKLTHLLATPIVETLGLTLVHFLWQGALVAVIFAALLHLLKNSSAATRYKTACIGLVLMSVLPVATYTYLYPTPGADIGSVELTQTDTPPSPALTTDTALPATQPDEAFDSARAPFADVQPRVIGNSLSSVNLKAYLPWLVAIWLLGVIGLSIRLVGGLFLTYQLRTKATRPVSAALEASLQTVLKKLGIRQQVKLRESLAVTVPVVIGWLRPVVLLPTSVITGLSQEQLELILTHELAHVRRYDYLVNILQKMVETLLFYHPAVGWLLNVIRQEREHCCDDLVVSLYRGQNLSYARTLSQLETMRSSQRLALAANDGVLVKRIQRLAGKPDTATYSAESLSGLALTLVVALIFSLASAQATLPVEIEQNIDAFMENRLEAWGGAPGAQVAIIQDGEVTFNEAYGLADVETGRKMSIDTPILLGPEGSFYFVMLAVQQLIDKGQLSFDDTVADILPWVRFLEGEESEITAANLRDGDANIIDTIYPEGLDPFSETGIPGTLNPDITTAEEYIRSLMPDDLETASNRFNSFLNNDTLLILMVEEVSGLSFQDYMEQNVFAPLGMEATFAFEDAQQNGLATFYKNGDEGALETVNISIPAPFGPALGLSMSSQDMAKFVMAVLEKDPQIFSEEAWEIFAPISTDVEKQANSWAELLGSVGYSSGSQTVMEFIPSLETGYVAMTNYQSDQASQPLVLDIAQSVSTSLELLKENSPVLSRSVREDGLSKASRYTLDIAPGSYLSALGPIELFAKEDDLHGTLLGQDFRLDRLSNLYIIDSDYEPMDNFILTINAGKINIDGRPLAFKVE